MRLLIITQKVNDRDPVLGFFVRWLGEFSHHFESIIVICLEKGTYNLPPNVTVLSLGKESGESRLKYVLNFWKHIWQNRASYDGVFVHMNVEYIILGALLWKFLRKKIVLWYNHTLGKPHVGIAFALADVLCHTSQYALSAGKKKSQRMPAGIDTSLFKTFDVDRNDNSILYVGRIAPVKRIHILIEAAKTLSECKKDFTLGIYGDAFRGDADYLQSLKHQAETAQLRRIASFHQGVPNFEMPKIYSSFLLFVNLTARGNFDKTVLEAAACGTIPVVSSEAWKECDSMYFFEENDTKSLAEALSTAFNETEESRARRRKGLREYVEKQHELKVLARKLKFIYEQ